MYSKGGYPVAFVEFTDAASAIQATNNLQGTVLLSSERGGIRIEQAKSHSIEVRIIKLIVLVFSSFFLSFNFLYFFSFCQF